MEADKTTHQFKPNSRFEDAVALYNFDIELRDLMFKAVQRLEIALRTKIIQEFFLAHGPFWFFDTNGLDFKNELKSLLVSYPQVDPAAMGFPENWISEPLWR